MDFQKWHKIWQAIVSSPTYVTINLFYEAWEVVGEVESQRRFQSWTSLQVTIGNDHPERGLRDFRYGLFEDV